MGDYIPRSDASFNNWQASLLLQVVENQSTWGISIDSITNLKLFQSRWDSAYSKAKIKQNRTSADVRARDDASDEYVTAIREFVAEWLANNSKVTDADRERMGLHIKSGSRTPVPVPTTIPVGSVDFSVRLQHTIHFVDEETPRSKAKPEGVHACEIWMKIDGEAPRDASELTYLGTCTRTPFKTTFDGAKAGKYIFYWLRWINNRSKPGPWSSTVSAMIVG